MKIEVSYELGSCVTICVKTRRKKFTLLLFPEFNELKKFWKMFLKKLVEHGIYPYQEDVFINSYTEDEHGKILFAKFGKRPKYVMSITCDEADYDPYGTECSVRKIPLNKFLRNLEELLN